MSPKPTILLVTTRSQGGTQTYLHSLLKLKTFYHFKTITLQNPSFSQIIPHRQLITSILQTQRPKLVVSIGTYANLLLTSFSSTKFPFTHLATHHTPLDLTFKTSSPLTYPFIKPFLPRLFSSSYHLCVSQGLKQHLQTHFNLPHNRVKLIYNGVPTPSKSQLKTRSLHSPIRLLTIARFSPQKDHLTLLQALNLFKPKLKFHLTLVGQGPTLPTLLKVARQLSLSPYLKFIDHLPSLTHLYQTHDLFILPSHYEGLPYTLLEAIAHQLPPIATNVPYGPNEIIHSGRNGFLVPPQSPNQLAQAILRLSHPPIYRQILSHLHLPPKFTEPHMLNQYQQLFDSLLIQS